METGVFVVNAALVYIFSLGLLQTRLAFRRREGEDGKWYHEDLSLTSLERSDSRYSKVREPSGVLAKREQ